MLELFSLPKTNDVSDKKKNEYTKSYNLIYTYTQNKKLQDKLIEYIQFRMNDCKQKGYRFYSSSIKSFLDTIDKEMKNATDDEKWEAINLTLSYSSHRLLVPFSKQPINKSIEGFVSEVDPTLNHTQAKDANGNLIKF